MHLGLKAFVRNHLVYFKFVCRIADICWVVIFVVLGLWLSCSIWLFDFCIICIVRFVLAVFFFDLTVNLLVAIGQCLRCHIGCRSWLRFLLLLYHWHVVGFLNHINAIHVSWRSLWWILLVIIFLVFAHLFQWVSIFNNDRVLVLITRRFLSIKISLRLFDIFFFFFGFATFIDSAILLFGLFRIEMLARLCKFPVNLGHDISWNVDDLTEGGLCRVTCLRCWKHNLVLEIQSHALSLSLF